VTTLERAAAALFLLAATLFALMFARLSAQGATVPSPVTLTWDAPALGPRPTGYKVTIDATTEDAGAALVFSAPLPPGPHLATVRAYGVDGQLSAPSNELAFTVAQPATDPCHGHPVSIAIKSYTATVAVGARGQVLFDLLNPYPIVQVFVKIGPQVVGQFNGTDLRDVAGAKFSVPRTPGPYPLGVQAIDSANCQGATSALRTVTVQ
jgi:hypothetical protein